VLHGLGFKDDQIDGDVGALSGGWKMRVALARVLLGMPDVLLMDEPTNHLDIESIIWLEQFLKSFPGALLMTSHDREFMNRLVSKIAEIDGGDIIIHDFTDGVVYLHMQGSCSGCPSSTAARSHGWWSSGCARRATANGC